MKLQHVHAVREFNRFYTGVIGVLDQHILQSAFSLPEARILYELHHRQPCTASEIVDALHIDKGYLSRMIDQFQKKGLLVKRKKKEDSRAAEVSLTSKGNKEFEALNKATLEQIKDLLNRLSSDHQQQLLNHMDSIQKLLK